jgi:hypothetical protein
MRASQSVRKFVYERVHLNASAILVVKKITSDQVIALRWQPALRLLAAVSAQ